MTIRAALSAGITATVLAVAASIASAKDTYPPLDVLLSTTTTTIGQSFEYPDGQAKITAAIVTMQPGQKTGWHKHDAPLFAYILEGEITVDYGPDGPKTYKTGDSFVQAFESEHNGQNTGDGITRILAVFAGAEGTPNTVSEKN